MARIYISSTILEPGLCGEEFDLDFETAKKLRAFGLTSGETDLNQTRTIGIG